MKKQEFDSRLNGLLKTPKMSNRNNVLPKQILGTPVKDYLDSRDFHYNRTWHLVNGLMMTKVNGEWMNENEFREKYPIKTAVNFLLRPSPDTSKFYID
jgi:hypothetical protein